ncbi:hypothetical protein F4824DRAFT_95433 [Ustulina deusta]|nr:hypothetical protein F4824DRAFT_43127 [Ustulina deusta]KAI3337968.1 hypothetical protein F4824DRAFT_95433 [Ustulina deusta]
MLTELSIPTSCLTETWLLPAHATAPAGAVLGNPADSKCWAGTQNPGTIISPAICPSGYTSACDIDPQSRRDASETVWACCPSDFTCDGGTYSCNRNFNDKASRTYFLTGTNNLGETTTTPVVVGGVNAHSVRVAFHSSDILDRSTTDSSRPTSTPVPIGTPSLSTPAPSVTSPVPNSESISAGGFVGIGVASGLGAVLLLSGLFWLVRRWRRNKQHTTGSRFKPARKYAELFSISQPSELTAARTNVYELDSREPNNNNNNNNNNNENNTIFTHRS